ncbi:serine/arginine repetitive matrix protein 2-like [Selaginella moellendorffii]|uniref:serine/arginine repetitive matrix protein 2-like n=1 Tax=Selaginella moellendorffii TaxID=88036 RepID=UPI000D1D0FF7|nr:serine/arginine repetitive matrix protein 2-like [Selaginella moellendorffii]|eukprot:XP_024520274.1 serine/arginine repetitive matrix protein 2-like [Selaginella moellendorffii]
MLRRAGGGGSSSSWEDMVAARHYQQQQQQQQPQRRDEDLALFQDMRIREEHNGSMEAAMDQQHTPLHGSSNGKGSHIRGGLAHARSRGSNDLLTSETDKNDYDWLLTPPGTPLFPSLDRDWLVASPTQREREPQRERESSRWPSKLSRLSAPEAQQLLVSSSSSGSSGGSGSRLYTSSISSSSGVRGNPSPRRQSAPPATTSFSSSRPKQLVAATSTAATTSVANGSSGNARPSTPTRRPSTAPSPSPSLSSSARRPSTPTPAPRSSTSSRPSTPTRPSPASSRSSTPTRRSSSSTSTPTSTLVTSTMSNGRSSRGTSPVRRSQQPAAAHERSSSNSRGAAISRTDLGGAASTLPSHLTRSYNHLDRDMSSFSRRAVTSTNDSLIHPKSEPLRKPATTKACSGGPRETSFYGTSISKKSLDTAIRHMDIRRSSPSGFRSVPAVTSSFPKPTTMPRSSQLHQQQQQQQAYDRLLSSERQEQQRQQHKQQDKSKQQPVELFEHESLDGTDSFLLELTEARFLDEADYLKDPPDIMK